MDQALEVFRNEAAGKGSNEVLVREWPPSKVTGLHTHPFSVWVRVIRGEMWLTVGNDVRHFRSGEEFTLARDVQHSERYGEEGATLWVGRRHAGNDG